MNLRASVPEGRHAVVERAATAGRELFDLSESFDRHGRFPAAGLEILRRTGLLTAPLPRDLGGADLGLPAGAGTLFDVLRRIGAGDLSVGRLYEGHVNAVALVCRYGSAAQITAMADAVRDGAMSAVWNAERADKLLLRPDGDGWMLSGGKVLASGAGCIDLPLVTARSGEDQWMALPRLRLHERADLSGWTAQGMRSSATGTIDLSGLRLQRCDLIGSPGDYQRQPMFSGGAWRFCAVQLGAIERLVDLFRAELVDRQREGDPFQKQRLAECAAAAETAALWIEKAAGMAADDALAPDLVVAYVGLTRMVTERAGLDVLERVHRGAGLAAFMRPHPVERISRDLATYLRQPAPDGAMADAATAVLASRAAFRDVWRAE